MPVTVVFASDEALAPSREEVRSLYLRAFSGPPLSEGKPEADLFSALYERALGRADAVVTYSRADRLLVGICYGHPWSWQEQTDAWANETRSRLPSPAVDFLDGAFAVFLLAVDPDHQRAGLGSELLTALLRHSSCERAWLVTTDVDSPAKRFYLARDWRVLGRGADAPNGRPALVLGLRRSLVAGADQQ